MIKKYSNECHLSGFLSYLNPAPKISALDMGKFYLKEQKLANTIKLLLSVN